MPKFLLIVFAAFILTSCSTSGSLETSIPEQNISIAEYKIGAGDQLYINV